MTILIVETSIEGGKKSYNDHCDWSKKVNKTFNKIRVYHSGEACILYLEESKVQQLNILIDTGFSITFPITLLHCLVEFSMFV